MNKDWRGLREFMAREAIACVLVGFFILMAMLQFLGLVYTPDWSCLFKTASMLCQP